jgi:hypothetical protein
MTNTNPSHKLKTLISALGLVVTSSAFAVDAFDSASNLLTMDRIATGGVTYRNVAISLPSYDLVGVGGGTPVADSFTPANNTLLLGAVAFQGTVYNNVSIKVNTYSVLSVGGSGTPGTLGAPNYTAEMAGYLAALNNYRTQCGIPALAQNTKLDSVAYSIGTGTASQYALAAAASYSVPDTAGGISSDYHTNSTNDGLVGVYELQTAMMSPGALLNLMRPYTEIGMALDLGKAGSVHQRGARVMFGNPVSRNIVGPITFPCANTTDVSPYQNIYVGGVYYTAAAPTGEFSGLVLNVNGQQGTPIAVFANPGESLVLTNASVIMRGGAGVPIILTSNDRNLYPYEGYVWPQQNLLPNTTYDVLIFGTINGVAFRKEFPFKTGAAIPFNVP